MSALDVSYQKAVDEETDKILKLSVADFLKTSDKNIETVIDGRKILVSWFRQHFNNRFNHIVVMAERRWFLFFHKKYLNGVKLENGQILKLNEEEICAYD
jgi:hypothetical protein